jgi:hypothetical protein
MAFVDKPSSGVYEDTKLEEAVPTTGAVDRIHDLLSVVSPSEDRIEELKQWMLVIGLPIARLVRDIMVETRGRVSRWSSSNRKEVGSGDRPGLERRVSSMLVDYTGY